jgi:uncharacterized protein (DUF305 family)
MRSLRYRLSLSIVALTCATACHHAAPQPVKTASSKSGPKSAVPVFTEADVEFMQGMIGHHAQALDMAALVPSRTRNHSIHLLAQRIEISQRDEIRRMQTWLRDRSQSVPDPHMPAMHHGSESGDMLMPGMLTPEQMAQLTAARDAEFDALFLRLMIQHHEGALSMVKTLFSSPGAAQETATFRYASDVDSDQRIEIERMRKMLSAMPESHPS